MSGPPRPQTVDDVSARLEHYLIRVPQVGKDVCAVCRGAVYGGYPMCFQCNRATEVLQQLRLDAVSFVSLAPKGEQLARDLYTYKKQSVPQELRNQRLVGLAAVLWRWLSLHEICLALSAGASTFEIVTTVPSSSGRSALEGLVGDVVEGTGERTRSVLAVARTDLKPRQFASDRFSVTEDVEGRDVLVIDDTWTSGAKLQAAAAALKLAGARRVAGVAIGRWMNREFQHNGPWIDTAKQATWSWWGCGSKTCNEPPF